MMGGGDPQHKAVKIGERWREGGRKAGRGREVNAVNDVSVNEWIDARLPTDGGRETDAYMRTSYYMTIQPAADERRGTVFPDGPTTVGERQGQFGLKRSLGK